MIPLAVAIVQGYVLMPWPHSREPLADYGVRVSEVGGSLAVERDPGPWAGDVTVRAFLCTQIPPPKGWASVSAIADGTFAADLSARLGAQALPLSGRFMVRNQADGTGRWLCVEVEALMGPGDGLVASVFLTDLREPDRDGNGTVGAEDLAILQGDWGTGLSDLDGDGTTGPADLGILLGAWNAG